MSVMPAGEQGPTETGESGHSIRPLITGLYTTTPRIVQILPLKQSRHIHRVLVFGYMVFLALFRVIWSMINHTLVLNYSYL